MKHRSFFTHLTIAVCCLTLIATAAAADEAAAPAAPAPAVETVPAMDPPPIPALHAEPVFMFASARDDDDSYVQSRGLWQADCWNGSTVTCTGSFGFGRDSNCSSNQRGYCYGTTTGYRYCPVCPTAGLHGICGLLQRRRRHAVLFRYLRLLCVRQLLRHL